MCVHVCYENVYAQQLQVEGVQGAVAGVRRRIRRDEDPSSGLASLRTSKLFLRIARVRRNEAPLPDESVCSRRVIGVLCMCNWNL